MKEAHGVEGGGRKEGQDQKYPWCVVLMPNQKEKQAIEHPINALQEKGSSSDVIIRTLEPRTRGDYCQDTGHAD